MDMKKLQESQDLKTRIYDLKHKKEDSAKAQK